MATRDTLIQMLWYNATMSLEDAGKRADELLHKGLLDSNDVAQLYGTSPVVVTVWARKGRIEGSFKPNSEWSFLVDKLPDKVRLSHSGRGGLPQRLKQAIWDEGNDVPARVLTEKYGVSRATIYKLRKEMAKATV